MSYHTTELKSFTRQIREILNSTEYGFHHKDTNEYKAQELLNCIVEGSCYGPVEKLNLVATVHGRHVMYPKWKRETYLRLMDLVENMNMRNQFNYIIQFTGAIRFGQIKQLEFSEMMKIDLT